MTSVKDIVWIAALLEGEGCFMFHNRCPQIQLCMVDLDTVEKARLILDINRTNKIGKRIDSRKQDIYTLNISGDPAIQWMMTIYSLMSIRRKAKLREIMQKWKEISYLKIEGKKKGYAERSIIQSVAMSRKISYDEARKIWEQISNKVN